MKVFHERVSFFYLPQNLHNPYISFPGSAQRSLRAMNFIGVVYRRRHRFHETYWRSLPP
ncbi:hypothetical protein [uncultured Nostoc sp.]|uniref:hypothetical protein n=1 Tax=uncultured Nostoc sp. TaxID=340711 RepID=UPI0035CA4D95